MYLGSGLSLMIDIGYVVSAAMLSIFIGGYISYSWVKSLTWGRKIFPYEKANVKQFGFFYKKSDYPILQEKIELYNCISYQLWEIDYTYYDQYYHFGYLFAHKHKFRPKKWCAAYLNKFRIRNDYYNLKKQKQELENEIIMLEKLSVLQYY